MSQKLFYIAIILILLGSSLCSEITAVEEDSAKFLVSITFEDGKSCIGALISRLKIATSQICLDKFRFASRIYKKPCKVLAGIQPNPGKDVGIWRFCVGRPKVLQYPEDARDSISLDLFHEKPPSYIEIDLPFDNYVVTLAKMGKPNLEKNESCTVYGYGKQDDANKPAVGDSWMLYSPRFSAYQPYASPNIIRVTLKFNPNISYQCLGSPKKGNANEEQPQGGRRRKRQTDNGDTLLSRKASILALENCKRLYREYMDDLLPENQFCVAEGGISDLGRILVCTEKVVGTVVDDMAIFQENGNTIYAYTALSNGSYHMKFLVSKWIEITMCLMMLWSWSKMHS